jgi:hypothetical protein
VSCENRNPVLSGSLPSQGQVWIPAYAGMTQKETFQRAKVFPFLVKKSFRRIAFVKGLSMAKINMPMDDQV